MTPSGSWVIPNRPEVRFRGLVPINAHRTTDGPKNRGSSRDADFSSLIRTNFRIGDKALGAHGQRREVSNLVGLLIGYSCEWLAGLQLARRRLVKTTR